MANKLTDEGKNLVLFLFLVAIWVGLETISILVMNYYWFTKSRWGISFLGGDIRTWVGGYILGIFYAWYLYDYWEERKFKKWLKKRKQKS